MAMTTLKRGHDADVDKEAALAPLAKRRRLEVTTQHENVSTVAKSSDSDALIGRVYRLIFKRTDLLPVSDHDGIAFPVTVTPTYGEIQKAGFQRILNVFLAHGLDDNDPREEAESPPRTFLDIGSGYGKPVFHTALATRHARCHGMEYVPERVLTCNDVLLPTVERLAPGVSRRITFNQGDVTQLPAANYDFIYFYDPLDHAHVTDAIEELLMRSRFTLFATFQPPHRFTRGFLTCIEHFPVPTTGRQRFNVYFYKRLDETAAALIETSV
jgi:hypothetical protein